MVQSDLSNLVAKELNGKTSAVFENGRLGTTPSKPPPPREEKADKVASRIQQAFQFYKEDR